MAKIIRLTPLLYGRKTINKKCRQCGDDLEVGSDICSKRSFTTNKTFSRPSTHWYHVECAERLNII